MESALDHGLAFTFTEGHADMKYSRFFEDIADLDKVDWPLMEQQWWKDTVEDPDRKRRRQAEFLVHDFFPWKLVSEIGVIDSRIAKQVGVILQDAAHKPVVKVKRSWYY